MSDRMSRNLTAACWLSLLTFLIMIIAFSTPSWLANDGLLPDPKFHKLAFFTATQTFFTFSFTMGMLVCIGVLAFNFVCPTSWEVQALRIIGCGSVGAGIFGGIAVIIFGALGDSRDFMPHWEHNYLSWSFAFGVVGTMFQVISGILFLVESRRLRKRMETSAGGTGLGTAFASYPSDRPVNTPWMKWTGNMRNVYAMAATDRLLVAAGDGPVYVWPWEPMYRQAKPNPVILHILPQGEPGEIHGISSLPGTNSLLFACSSGLVSVVDPHAGKTKQSLRASNTKAGSKPSVFSVAARDENCIVGGQSDGIVSFWDVRKGKDPAFRITPADSVPEASPGSGRLGVTAVDVHSDWMVCGGGMKASLWHIGSRKMSVTYEADASRVLSVLLIGSENGSKKGLNTVLVAGQSEYVSGFNLEGVAKARIPTSSTCVYNVNHGWDFKDDRPVLTASGTSHKINVFAEGLHALDFVF
ncbi:unnamed protein product [Notodromas monacha]|uniref:Uncharacterized protein n=1 Tax=Notodromas monacha TaxID=399045 RepID=A0A7R9BJ80_9CRUS|nr:unnamed protein product [Notodromas monacha]CAG0915408.1 unnamed protein product [Notodromas monacha]